jgi:hypothetical protein
MDEANDKPITAADQQPQRAQPASPSPVTDPACLAQEICERQIPLPSTATPAEVIPWTQKGIVLHNEIGPLIASNSHSYPAWKPVMDDLQTFLENPQALEAAKISSENPAKNPATIANQQHPTRPEPGQTRPELAKARPKGCQT